MPAGKHAKPMKSCRITESTNLSPIQAHIKLTQYDETLQASTCSKLLINVLDQLDHCVSDTNPAGVYLFKVNNGYINDVFLVPLLLTLNIFHTLFQCFHCWVLTSKCRLGKQTQHINHLRLLKQERLPLLKVYLLPDVSLFGLPLHILKVFDQYYQQPK